MDGFDMDGRPTDEERIMKAWIDAADYQTLLEKWRFAGSGDPFFIGEIGSYYKSVLFRKGEEVGHASRVSASKAVGWEKR
jgi:hypothetical protein